MAISDPQLLEYLACPEDKGPLWYFEDEDALYNPRLRRRYLIRDGIPVMLIDEGQAVDDAEHDRLMAKAEADGVGPNWVEPDARVTLDASSQLGSLHPLDSLNMVGAAAALADQIELAAGGAAEVDGLPSADGVTSVAVLGMGGSGIGGDIAAAVCSPDLPVPFTVVKGYSAPGCIGPGTLVFASSFSGNTEETLEAATEAHERGGRLVVLSNGGELAARARAWEVPWIPIQDGIPMPRAGIGAVSVPLLVVLERMGLWGGASEQIGSAVAQLRRRTEQLSRAGAPAEVLARRIGRTMPIVYGGGPLGEVAAIRWKGQFNENAKLASFANRVPELTHNEICGWGLNGDVTRQVFSLILLRHAYEHPQVARRFELVEEICTEIVADVHTVEAEGDTPLAQLFDLVLVGDYTTLELALQVGIDPGPVAILDEIKARLRA